MPSFLKFCFTLARKSSGKVLSASRTLTTAVWYPVGTAGPWPLVVFAHGYRLGVGPYVHLCQTWAAAGYVVAAPTFPLTDEAVAGSNLDEGVGEPPERHDFVHPGVPLEDGRDPGDVRAGGLVFRRVG